MDAIESRKRVLSLLDLARTLGVNRLTIESAISKGTIVPSFRTASGRVRFDRDYAEQLKRQVEEARSRGAVRVLRAIFSPKVPKKPQRPARSNSSASSYGSANTCRARSVSASACAPCADFRSGQGLRRGVRAFLKCAAPRRGRNLRNSQMADFTELFAQFLTSCGEE